MTFPAGPLGLVPLELDGRDLTARELTWHVPGSKSITNRALVLAALAEGTTVLRGVLHSDDTRHMRRCLEQLGIEISFLKATLLILFSALLLGASLAFGIGGRDLVANILSAHYVHRLYQVGQVVRVDGVEGRIVRIAETSVILECAEGDVSIPARVFADSRSTLIVRRKAGEA